MKKFQKSWELWIFPIGRVSPDFRFALVFSEAWINRRSDLTERCKREFSISKIIFLHQTNVCICRKSRFFTEKKIGRNCRDFSGFRVFMNLYQEANQNRKYFSGKMQKRSLYLQELRTEWKNIRLWRKSWFLTILKFSSFTGFRLVIIFVFRRRIDPRTSQARKCRKWFSTFWIFYLN